MDYYSLEEDDASGLFITQESSRINDEIGENHDESGDNFLGVMTDDFQSPCVSLVTGENTAHYSDISEDEQDFEKEKSR